MSSDARLIPIVLRLRVEPGFEANGDRFEVTP
jgi:hypothetical protein